MKVFFLYLKTPKKIVPGILLVHRFVKCIQGNFKSLPQPDLGKNTDCRIRGQEDDTGHEHLPAQCVGMGRTGWRRKMEKDLWIRYIVLGMGPMFFL